MATAVRWERTWDVRPSILFTADGRPVGKLAFENPWESRAHVETPWGSWRLEIERAFLPRLTVERGGRSATSSIGDLGWPTSPWINVPGSGRYQFQRRGGWLRRYDFADEQGRAVVELREGVRARFSGTATFRSAPRGAAARMGLMITGVFLLHWVRRRMASVGLLGLAGGAG